MLCVRRRVLGNGRVGLVEVVAEDDRAVQSAARRNDARTPTMDWWNSEWLMMHPSETIA
jgi:hypothetical protein